jgi:hypothetical protein
VSLLFWWLPKLYILGSTQWECYKICGKVIEFAADKLLTQVWRLTEQMPRLGRQKITLYIERHKKVGLPLGTGSPEKARSIVSVVFTPTRGVIHPSFPLRGRWERSAKNDEQAPSPSLTALYISSCKTRLLTLLLQERGHRDQGPQLSIRSLLSID